MSDSVAPPHVVVSWNDKEHTLHVGDLIGRMQGVMLWINDPEISEIHAYLSLRDGSLCLRAAGGSLGVNATRGGASVGKPKVAAQMERTWGEMVYLSNPGDAARPATVAGHMPSVQVGGVLHLSSTVTLKIVEVYIPSALLSLQSGAQEVVLDRPEQSVWLEPWRVVNGAVQGADLQICWDGVWQVRLDGGTLPLEAQGQETVLKIGVRQMAVLRLPVTGLRPERTVRNLNIPEERMEVELTPDAVRLVETDRHSRREIWITAEHRIVLYALSRLGMGRMHRRTALAEEANFKGYTNPGTTLDTYLMRLEAELRGAGFQRTIIHKQRGSLMWVWYPGYDKVI